MKHQVGCDHETPDQCVTSACENKNFRALRDAICEQTFMEERLSLLRSDQILPF